MTVLAEGTRSLDWLYQEKDKKVLFFEKFSPQNFSVFLDGIRPFLEKEISLFDHFVSGHLSGNIAFMRPSCKLIRIFLSKYFKAQLSRRVR